MCVTCRRVHTVLLLASRDRVCLFVFPTLLPSLVSSLATVVHEWSSWADSPQYYTKDIIVVDTFKNVDPNRELVADLLTNDFGFHPGTRSKRSSKNSKCLRLLPPVGGDGFIYTALPVRQYRVYLSRVKQKNRIFPY